jgi:hypothetical protein
MSFFFSLVLLFLLNAESAIYSTALLQEWSATNASFHRCRESEAAACLPRA